MNEIFHSLGIGSWKPVIGALLLPPVPLLLLILVGARLMFRRRLLAWSLILLGVLGLYFAATPAGAYGLQQLLLRTPRALAPSEIGDLKRAPKTAIVVLGGGRIELAPEYGVSSLKPRAMERLRYGIWLARETGLPLAFSGGVGHGDRPGSAEAEIAARIAEREYRLPLKWTETESRDTRENAFRTVSLLRASGIEQIVLVTEGYHMPRALANFEDASAGAAMRIVAAPMGLSTPMRGFHLFDWLPSHQSQEMTRLVLHEWIGRLAGA
jgi:uncharacterized SAM-binding protein YcdF (DUF218 family)